MHLLKWEYESLGAIPVSLPSIPIYELDYESEEVNPWERYSFAGIQDEEIYLGSKAVNPRSKDRAFCFVGKHFPASLPVFLTGKLEENILHLQHLFNLLPLMKHLIQGDRSIYHSEEETFHLFLVRESLQGPPVPDVQITRGLLDCPDSLG